MRTPGNEGLASGRLPDGTPYWGALGVIAVDEDADKVQCHLCGAWFRFIGGTHLVRRHGVHLAEYREMFQLSTQIASCAPGTSAIRNRISREQELVASAREHRRQPTAEERARRPQWKSVAARLDLMRLWHPTRSSGIDPTTIAPTTVVHRLWWRCQECGYEWQARPRTASWRRCGGQRAGAKLSVVPRERSIAALSPRLAAELHPTRNGAIDPWTLAARTSKRLWWLCLHCGHQWQQRLTSGQRGRCPACAAAAHGRPVR
jgi:rubrerythrin